MQVEYHKNTHPTIRDLLEAARKTNQRIRLWYGDNEGSSWEQEDNVSGHLVPRVAPDGSCRPYLLHNSTSKVGQFILSDRIVKLMVGKSVVYEHPSFNQPDYCVITQNVDFDCPFWILDKTKVVKRFTTELDATRWIDFMKGLRMSASGRKS